MGTRYSLGLERMQIFLSYASEDRSLAEEIQLALLGAGHTVFFDKSSLPSGGDYHSRIRAAVTRSDLVIFLISPNSVVEGSYALTELKFARLKWPHPNGRVLPVRLHGTAWDTIPPYLKSVTALEPEGNIPAEIVEAIATIQPIGSILIQSEKVISPSPAADIIPEYQPRTKKNIALVLAAVLIISLAIWATSMENPKSMLPRWTDQVTPEMPEGVKGPDTGNARSLVLNQDCPEITEYDYSKSPPTSKIVKRCPQ
jgi:hypothetical protein